MASLPPAVTIGNTLKLDSEFKKHTFHFEKEKYNPNSNIKELDSNKAYDTISLDYRDALAFVEEGNQKLKSTFYVPLLQECIDKKSISGANSIHAHIVKSGFGQELFVVTFLINVYAKCGEMETARKLFDNLRKRNLVTWTSLMSGYVRNSQPELAVSVFKELLEAGSFPTNYTVGVALNACSSLSDIRFGEQVHGYVVKYDLERDTSIGNALCSLYSRCGSLDMMIKAFRRMEEKNVISWTTAISACGDNGDSAMGLDIFLEMLVEGLIPNQITITSVLSLCGAIHDLRMGSQVHSLSVKLGYGSDLPITNSLMYMYLKRGFLREAKELFDKMSTSNLVTWNALIAGHAEMSSLPLNSLSSSFYGTEALKIFQRMNISGLKPDMYTLSSVFTICSSLAALEQGEQVHAQTIKTGFSADVVAGTALVNMYNKCGSIDRASKAFLEMPARTLISWTSMLTAFAQHGMPQKALQLFDDMRFVGVRPNKITFTGVLSACSRLGAVDQAMAYFDMMKNEYNINPVMDHYACLIDMFVRVGQIAEAFDFMKQEEVTPNEFIWSSLIAGCRSQEKLDLAFYAAEQLLELKPREPETYYLLLNMYVSAGRYKDVSRVRKMIKDEKIDKLLDWSWISIRDKVYSFKPGDRRHASDEVAQCLDDLFERAKGYGYQVETDSQMVDDDSGGAKVSTAYHSEKLAVAFGLLNTVKGAQILVSKSVSMCRDCHEFMKVVSVLTSRTIIIRDSKRLHKFCGGECSCGILPAVI